MKNQVAEEKKKLQKFEFFRNKDLSGHLDFLTNVIDRGTIVEYLNFLVANNKKFTFCISDIDNFKKVNDTYGHLMGDKILKSAASALENAIGDCGVVGRFGGDEFFFVLEDLVEYKDVWDVCHKININLKHTYVEGIGEIFVSATTGVARFPLDAQNIDGIFDIADKALYRGKKKGRNCFIIYLPEKHKDFANKTDKSKKSNSEILSNFYKSLSNGAELEEQISHLFKKISNALMFDHICIETPTNVKYEYIFDLSYQKKFEWIDLEIYKNSIDENGMLCVNDTNSLKVSNEKLFDVLKKQGVTSTLCCKISAGGKDFGLLRIDATNNHRIWQQEEINFVQIVANTLALLLFYQNKEL